MEAVETVGSKVTDSAGRISYKFKEECSQLFDPFLIV
jgi:hypothetical protein